MNKIMRLFNRIKGNKTLMNGTLFSIFSFFNKGVNFILLILLARFIMPAEYGKLSLFTTIIQLLGFIIALSSEGYFSISYFQRKGEKFRQDATSIVLILVSCTTVLSVVLLLFRNTLSNLADMPPLFLWFALACSFFQIFNFLFTDLLRIEEKVIKYGLFSCGLAMFNFFLSLYLVVYKGYDWEGRVYATLICTVLSGVLGVILLAWKNVFTNKVTWEGTKIILLWAIPLIPHQAAMWLKQGMDRYIINGTHTIEDVGIFSFGLTLTSIIFMIGVAFNSTNSVTIYQILSSEVDNENKIKQLNRQIRNVGFIYLVCYIGVLLFGTVLVPLFLPKYTGSLPYFWITSVSGLMQCLYFLFSNFLFYYHKNVQVMKITFTTAILHLLLSLFLTRFSLYYTAIIYIISQGCLLLLVIKQYRKVIHEKLG